MTLDITTILRPWDTDKNRKTFYQKQNALLEPSLTEKPLTGDFNYTPTGPRWVLASFATSLAATGRLEVRNPQTPLWMKDCSLVGLQSLLQNSPSYALINNPYGFIYENPEADYFRRMALLDLQKVQFQPFPTPQTQYPFFPGPYGTLITNVTSFDYGAGIFGGNFGQGAINWATELWDDATGAIRYDQPMSLVLAKGTIGWIETQVSRGGGLDGNAGIAYVLLPKQWSMIDTLARSYVFRDDFMGAALDPLVWTVSETTPGNISINTSFAAVQGIGANAWTNGMYSVDSYLRAKRYSYVADGWVPPSGVGNVVFGLSNGAGVNYTDFLHGLSISNTGTAVIENGVFTGIGSLEVGSLYRLRVTPGLVNGAVYEIQGGRSYPMIGSSSWTQVADTRGGGSSAASFKIGYSAYATGKQSYLGDVRVYK